MFRIEHPRFVGTAAALAASLILLAVTPDVPVLERHDRDLLALLIGGHPEIVGRGSLHEPRQLGRREMPPDPGPPVLLTLEEDPEGWFEAMPPPPADMAVVLARLQAGGLPYLGIGKPLQWEAADTLAIEAARTMMDRFQGLVLGFPLKDSTAGEPVAAPFLRASLPVSSVRGNPSDLPMVNAISGASPELGGERTLAGFTQLVNEHEESDRAYLLARWSDRVVFCLPLALEIARRGVSFDQVQISINREILLGADGPRIPIDFRGRSSLPAHPAPGTLIPLQAVIAKTLPDNFPPGDRPVMIGDNRLLGPKEDVAWTHLAPAIDEQIRSSPVRASLSVMPRPDGIVEMLAAVVLAVLSGWLLRARHAELRALTAVLLTGVTAAALLVCTRHFGLAPVALAYAVIPPLAWLMVEFARLSMRIKIVGSGESPLSAEAVPPPAAGKQQRRKRRGSRRS